MMTPQRFIEVAQDLWAADVFLVIEERRKILRVVYPSLSGDSLWETDITAELIQHDSDIERLHDRFCRDAKNKLLEQSSDKYRAKKKSQGKPRPVGRSRYEAILECLDEPSIDP